MANYRDHEFSGLQELVINTFHPSLFFFKLLNHFTIYFQKYKTNQLVSLSLSLWIIYWQNRHKMMSKIKFMNYLQLVVLIQRRQWHPTLVLLPGKSHGQRSLVGCCPWGLEESDTTEATQQQQQLSLSTLFLVFYLPQPTVFGDHRLQAFILVC